MDLMFKLPTLYIWTIGPLLSALFLRGTQLLEQISTAHKKHLYFFRKEAHLRYQVIMDVFALDTIVIKRRFQLNYLMTSPKNLEKVRIFLLTKLLKTIPTITRGYFSANWLERECWDMFGLFFTKNRDLRRILNDYGFEAYPLRKDFPVTGYSEVFFDEQKKQVSIVPLQGIEEFRTISIINFR